jgi:hypothetical protein
MIARRREITCMLMLERTRSWRLQCFVRRLTGINQMKQFEIRLIK